MRRWEHRVLVLIFQAYVRLGKKVSEEREKRLHDKYADEAVVELYFFVDVGDETYDIRDSVGPKPGVWRDEEKWF
jgi:hypothetical protein